MFLCEIMGSHVAGDSKLFVSEISILSFQKRAMSQHRIEDRSVFG